MRLKLSQVVPVHDPIFFNALENNNAPASVTHTKQLALLIEGDGRQYILLRDVSRIRLAQSIQWKQIESPHFLIW